MGHTPSVSHKCYVHNGQQFRPAWTHLVHRPATQQPLTSLSTHTHTHIGPSSTSTGTGGSAPPHTLSGSANGQEHVTLLTVPGTMTFTLHSVNTLKGTWNKPTQLLSQSIMFQIKNITHNTKLPNTVHALCRLTYCSLCIVEDTVEWGQVRVIKCRGVQPNGSWSWSHTPGGVGRKGRQHMYSGELGETSTCTSEQTSAFVMHS